MRALQWLATLEGCRVEWVCAAAARAGSVGGLRLIPAVTCGGLLVDTMLLMLSSLVCPPEVSTRVAPDPQL